MEGNDIQFRAGGETPMTEEELVKAEKMAQGEIPTNIDVKDLTDKDLLKQGIQVRREEGDLPETNIDVQEIPIGEEIEMGPGHISRQSGELTDVELREDNSGEENLRKAA